MIEAMIEAAVSVGLSSATARELVCRPVKGSVAMLEETENTRRSSSSR
jgi:pyrroline-5-carboxylate reductase